MKLKALGVVAGLIAASVASSVTVAAGDVEAGAQKVAVCVACHGQNGVSASPEFPSLAGQVSGYNGAQLRAFKSGDRQNAIMAGMVAALSEQDMDDIDAYYASLEPAVQAVSEDDAEAARRGGKIYRGGYQPLSVAACMACHGPSGAGIPPSYPRVSGQHAAYLEAQLSAFKSGERKNEIMNAIAFRLSAEQIRELALFMSGVN